MNDCGVHPYKAGVRRFFHASIAGPRPGPSHGPPGEHVAECPLSAMFSRTFTRVNRDTQAAVRGLCGATTREGLTRVFNFQLNAGGACNQGGHPMAPLHAYPSRKRLHTCARCPQYVHMSTKKFIVYSLYIYMYASARGRAHARARMRGKICDDMWTYCGHFQTTPYHPCLRLATQP